MFVYLFQTRHQLADHTLMFDDAVKPFCWFLLPSEAAHCLAGNQSTQNAAVLPFCPPQLRESLGLPVFSGSHDNGDCDVIDYVLNSRDDSQSLCEANDRIIGNNKDLVTVTGKLAGTNTANQLEETKEQLELSTDLASKMSQCNEEQSHVSNNLPSDSHNIKEVTLKDISFGSCVAGSEKDHETKSKCQFRKKEKDYKTTPQPICDRGQTCDINVLKNMEDDSGLNCDNVHAKDSKLVTTKTINKDGLTNGNAENSDSICDENIEDRNSDKKQTETVKLKENVDVDMKIEHNDQTVCQDHRKRKMDGDNIPTVAEMKKSKEVNNGDKGKKEKRDKTMWFSPPKSIFAPFLKVSQ